SNAFLVNVVFSTSLVRRVKGCVPICTHNNGDSAGDAGSQLINTSGPSVCFDSVLWLWSLRSFVQRFMSNFSENIHSCSNAGSVIVLTFPSIDFLRFLVKPESVIELPIEDTHHPRTRKPDTHSFLALVILTSVLIREWQHIFNIHHALREQERILVHVFPILRFKPPKCMCHRSFLSSLSNRSIMR